MSLALAFIGDYTIMCPLIHLLGDGFIGEELLSYEGI